MVKSLENVKWFVVNCETGEALPLPGATLTRRLEEGTGRLAELIFTLGIPKKDKKKKKSDSAISNPFRDTSLFYSVMQQIIDEGKIGLRKAVRISNKGKDWDGNKFVKFLNRRCDENNSGFNVKFTGKFIRMITSSK